MAVYFRDFLDSSYFKKQDYNLFNSALFSENTPVFVIDPTQMGPSDVKTWNQASFTGDLVADTTYYDTYQPKIFGGAALSNTTLLLHGDLLLDSSAYNQKIESIFMTEGTASSGIYGTRAYSFTSSGSQITTYFSESFDMSKGSFTLDFFVNLDDPGLFCGLLQIYPSTTLFLDYNSGASNKLRFSAGNRGDIDGASNIAEAVMGNSAISTGWTHIALVRNISDNSYRIFLNGVLDIEVYSAENLYKASSIQIGNFFGKLCEVRFRKQAVWTSNFSLEGMQEGSVAPSALTATASKCLDTAWTAAGWDFSTDLAFKEQLNTFIPAQTFSGFAATDWNAVITKGNIGGSNHTVVFIYPGNQGTTL